MLNIILFTIYILGCSFWFFSIFSNKVGRGGFYGKYSVGKGGILSGIIFIAWVLVLPLVLTNLQWDFSKNYIFNLILAIIIGLPLGYFLLKQYEKYNENPNRSPKAKYIISLVILIIAIIFFVNYFFV